MSSHGFVIYLNFDLQIFSKYFHLFSFPFSFPFPFQFLATQLLGYAGNAETRNTPKFWTLSLWGVRRGACLQYSLWVGDNDRCG